VLNRFLTFYNFYKKNFLVFFSKNNFNITFKSSKFPNLNAHLTLINTTKDDFNYKTKNNYKYHWFLDSYKSSKIFQLFSVSYVNLIILLYSIIIWQKARIIYYLNNWVYSTNHKRIAVNYFWFVILSGICGMVLATIIRLEMAYPGIGILSGDSLQYLSIVTAHAVIMVFFMIMPLIFGAFGNFLLPTQLGVHDVAFPRLNSAAFWFLPAGLIMLAQLVCLDRRYQRMNCFNIREVQSLLKNRFFIDLVNESAHHNFLERTIIGLRFKTNDVNLIKPNTLLLHRFGVKSTNSTRLQSYDFGIYSNNSGGYFSFFPEDSIYCNLIKYYFTKYVYIPNLIITFTDCYDFVVNNFMRLGLNSDNYIRLNFNTTFSTLLLTPSFISNYKN